MGCVSKKSWIQESGISPNGLVRMNSREWLLKSKSLCRNQGRLPWRSHLEGKEKAPKFKRRESTFKAEGMFYLKAWHTWPDQPKWGVVKWGWGASQMAKAKAKGGEVHRPQWTKTAKSCGKAFGYRKGERSGANHSIHQPKSPLLCPFKDSEK